MKRKNNLKLFPIYKMISWDLLFYHPIVFLFLTIEKGISVPALFFVFGFFPLFRALFQIPSVHITDTIGKRKSLLLGNTFLSIGVFAIILGNNLLTLIIAHLFMAIGSVLKEICEPIILHDSIPETKSKPKIFAKLDSQGSSNYYVLGAIAAATTGFLFVFNYYLPIIISFVFSLMAILISARFEEIETINKPNKNSRRQNMRIYFRDLKQAFKFIFSSRRLKSLLLYSSIMVSLLIIFKTFQNDLLANLHVPAEYFGIIHALSMLVSAHASKKQAWFHTKFKNKTLSLFALSCSFSLLITGLFLIGNLNIYVIYIVAAMMIILFSVVRAPYFTLINRYYNSFSNPDIITKIYSAKSFIENLARATMFFFASWLIGFTNIAITLTVFGCILVITFIFILDYMKTRIGLKPNEYRKKDIEFTLIK
ncbi:MAG: MFS transporter [Oscillospiraceae bacterium]|nr:MFS transporter [Oscillospiraceae bacterium]